MLHTQSTLCTCYARACLTLAVALGGALIRMEDVRLAQFDASLQVLASVGINLLACAVFFHSLYFGFHAGNRSSGF